MAEQEVTVDIGAVLTAAAVAVGKDTENSPDRWVGQVSAYANALIPLYNGLKTDASAREIILVGTVLEITPQIRRKDGSKGNLAQIKFKADIGKNDYPFENLWIDLGDPGADELVATCQKMVGQHVRVLKRTRYPVDPKTGQVSERGHGHLIWIKPASEEQPSAEAPAPVVEAPAPAPAPVAEAPAPVVEAPAPAPAAAGGASDAEAALRARVDSLSGPLHEKVVNMIKGRQVLPPPLIKAVNNFIDKSAEEGTAATASAPAAVPAPAVASNDYSAQVRSVFHEHGISDEEEMDAIVSIACNMEPVTVSTVTEKYFKQVCDYIAAM